MRSVYIRMCRAFPGGTEAMAASMGLTIDALKNRIYERKGQRVSVEEAMLMDAAVR